MPRVSTRCNCAVSEVIGFILILMIVTGAVSFILLWGAPYMEQQNAKGRLDNALIQFGVINGIIRDDIVRQGSGSSSVVSFTTDTGNTYLEPKGERFIFYYSLDPSFDFNVSGLGDGDDTTFNLIVRTGSAQNMTIHYLYKGNDVFENKGNRPPFLPPSYPSGIYPIQGLQYPLNDAIQINIFDGLARIIGRIWLFDTGSIVYETSSSAGLYKVISENGGVVSAKDSNGVLYDEANIKIDENILAMRIIQFKPATVTSGSGQGEYKFTIKLNYSETMVDSDRVSGNRGFRIQIYGDASAVEAWTNYFAVFKNFSKFVNLPVEGTLYLMGNRAFTLSQSICIVNMKV